MFLEKAYFVFSLNVAAVLHLLAAFFASCITISQILFPTILAPELQLPIK
jgi:hypothetical protein